jgi:hypothetical protein
MIHPRSIFLAAGITFFTASVCFADETFPVVHNEPITVRIVGGINGMPLSNLHLVLLGGYDQSDLHDQLYREEVLTDSMGNARLPRQLANLPWLQVWVGSMPLCQSNPRKTSFSVELIRRDGLSAPNLCGPVSAEETPGVFTVFVKNQAEKLRTGVSITVRSPFTLTKSAATAGLSEEAPVAPVAPHVVPPEVTVAAVTVAPVKAPVEATPILAPAVSVAGPSTAPPATNAVVILPKVIVHSNLRRAGSKPTLHRSKPVPAVCTVQPPTTNAPTAKTSMKKALPRKTLVSAERHSKPLAGVRTKAKRIAPPVDLKKQE